jgi:predicted phage terminase large subunit-like protein
MAAAKGKFSAADFFESLRQLERDIRAKLEAEVDGFPDDPAASAARRQKAADDFRYFCRTYFPHYVKGEESAFHAFLFDRLPAIPAAGGGARELIAAPRGNAKSTYVSLLYVLWVVIYKKKRFPVILSDTLEQASVHLAAGKIELEFNRRLKQDFPDDTGAGPVWQYGEVVTRSGAKIKIGGSGKALRGFRHGAQRPDLVVCDDLENDENVQRPEQRDKLEKWLDKTVEPLGPPDGSMDLIYVNTFLHYDAVAVRKKNNPMWRATVFQAIIRWPDRMDLWQAWEEVLRNQGQDEAAAFQIEHRADMEQGAEVLWPGVQPLLALMQIRVRIGEGAFNSEYQNSPTDGAAMLFTDIQFWVNRLPEWVFLGVCDPSLGKSNKGGDPSAVLVGGFNRATGRLDVVEASIARRVPTLIMEHIIDFQKTYRCLRWGIESNQFQEFFRTELVRLSAERGYPVPAVPLIHSTDKDLRIQSLQPHVANGLIRLHATQTTLTEMLRFYPQHPHDDGPDALEMLWAMCRVASAGYDYRPANPRRDGLGFARERATRRRH